MVNQMIELKIVVDDEGQVKVFGPIADKIFCFRLLNAAYDAIQNYKEDKLIKPVTMKPVRGI